MARLKTLVAFALGVATFCSSASADVYRDIDQLARNIERQSEQLIREVRQYRHTPAYRYLVEDAREMERCADHLHDVARDHGSLAHMESDLRTIEAKFRHFVWAIDRVERDAAYGHGQIHGDTSCIRRLLRSIEADIRHLQEYIRSLRTPRCATNPDFGNRPSIYGSPYSSRWGGYSFGPQSSGFGYGYGFGSPGRSISIGGGSSRLTFRF